MLVETFQDSISCIRHPNVPEAVGEEGRLVEVEEERIRVVEVVVHCLLRKIAGAGQRGQHQSIQEQDLGVRP